MSSKRFIEKTAVAVLALILCAGPYAGAKAMDISDVPDAYTELSDERLKASVLKSLAAERESSTGVLFAFLLPVPNKSGSSAEDGILLQVVQDRGLPRGEDYPTFVFRSGAGSDTPKLIFKTHAGKKIYLLSADDDPTGCLISAIQGYSDICLADASGQPAPDLPGLRKDFWSDLIKLFGL